MNSYNKIILSYIFQMDLKLKELINLSINGALFDIATVIYHLFKDEYVSARLKNKLWFKFDGLRWKQIEEGPYYELSTSVLSYYEQYLKELLREEYEHIMFIKEKDSDLNLETNSELEIMKNTLKNIQTNLLKINTIMDKLKNVTFKEALCKECLYFFYDPDFIGKLDWKENLICFKDLLYDARTETIKIPEKTDMVSVYIDANYFIPQNEEEMYKLKTIIEQFIHFRKNILKKRQPKNAYHSSAFV